MSGLAYVFLTKSIVKHHGKGTKVHQLTSWGVKEKVSLILNISGILLAFIKPYFGMLCFVSVAVIWFIPSKKIEKYSIEK